MRTYAYLVARSQNRPEKQNRFRSRPELLTPAAKRSRRISLLFILGGLILLGTAGWPVIQWQIIQAYDVAEGALIKPVVDLMSEVETQKLVRPSQFGQLLLPADLGTFDQPPRPIGGFDKRVYITDFFLSVPKLKINRALVKVDSDSFDQWLAHYPGSALPGEDGNVFISGHSVLPQFYNPNDYKAIFSTIHTLEPGDEFVLEMGGVEYRYVVQSKRVVDSEEVSVLNPPAAGKFVTLLTCNPPGTFLKRLVVLGKLAE